MIADLDICSIVASFGPQEPDIAEVTRLPDGEVIVRYDDDIVVTFETEAETDRVVLSAEIGGAAPDARLAVYTTLLQYSLLWRDTGGVHMALTAGGEAVQLLTLTGAEITPDLLFIVLRNFTAKARLMRGYVATGAAADKPDLPEQEFVIRA